MSELQASPEGQDLRKFRIGIVAGEASGDLIAAHLIQAIKTRVPNVDFVGIAGPKMQAAGARTLFPMESLAVRGYVEVLRHYREIVGIRNKLKQQFLDNPPDLFIGVDAPDFNLKLEEALKKRGIPTLHYVGPSIWAWRAERMGQIARAVSHILVLFPFEQALYENAGVPVTYVGHPLADMLPEEPDREAAREQLRIVRPGTVLAMLPGSRVSELEAMAELFVRTAQLIADKLPQAQFLVPIVNRDTRRIFEEALYRCGAQDLPITLLFGHAHAAMTAADAVIVASGTATLEAALLKRPMVITYKMPRLSWSIIKRKRYQPYVGLPNILAGRFIVPELLQEEALPENLAQATLNLLKDEVVRNALETEFTCMHRELRQNTAAKAAEAVMQFLPG